MTKTQALVICVTFEFFLIVFWYEYMENNEAVQEYVVLNCWTETKLNVSFISFVILCWFI